MLELPVFQIIPCGKVRLLQDWKVNETTIIPKDFESDLGSIPRSFWWFLHPNDITYSSIIHDYHWLLADSEQFNYQHGNLIFLKNCIELDEIKHYKAYICFLVLEIMRFYKFLKMTCKHQFK